MTVKRYDSEIQLVFPSTTAMIFYQASAPTGWTAVAVNDKFLRVVTAGGTGGTTGGTHAASINIGTHTHTGPSHTHTVPDTDGVDNSGGDNTDSMGIRDSAGTVRDPAYFGYATGASTQGQHGHFINSATGSSGTGATGAASIGSGSYAYADIIIATKD